MTAFVYRWTDHRHNKYYIGAHKGQPDDGYVCSSKVMLAEYRLRRNDFTRDILDIFGTWQDALTYECDLLVEVDAKNNPTYYNRSNGCRFYTALTEETKAKISRANKGRTPSAEARNKMSEKRKGQPSIMLGKTHSEETKYKMSQRRKGRPLHENQRIAIVEANRVREWSEESKLKISMANTGKEPWNRNVPHSPEVLIKMSENRKGKGTAPKSEATKEKMRTARHEYWNRRKNLNGDKSLF